MTSPGVVARNVVALSLALFGLRRVRRPGPDAFRFVASGVAFALAFAGEHIIIGFGSNYFQYLLPPLWVLCALGAAEITEGRRSARLPTIVAGVSVALPLLLVSPEVSDAYGAYEWYKLIGSRASRLGRRRAPP